MFEQFIDKVDVGVSQLIALVLSLGGSWVGQPVNSPSSSTSERALQHGLACSLSATGSKGQGRFPVLKPSGPAHPCHQDHFTILLRQVAGPLSRVLQLVRDVANSVQFLDINMVPSGSLDQRHPHGL